MEVDYPTRTGSPHLRSYHTWRNFQLPLPGTTFRNGTGTLRRLNSGFPGAGVVRAKTGTLGQVSTVVGYLGRAEGTLLVSLMYNGSRPGAARQAQWKLFRLLGANGVVIPADTSAAEPPQLGGEQTAPPEWWPKDSSMADTAGEMEAADTTEGD